MSSQRTNTKLGERACVEKKRGEREKKKEEEQFVVRFTTKKGVAGEM